MNIKNIDKKVSLDVLIKLSKLNNFNINNSLNIKKYIPFEEKILHIENLINQIIDKNGNYNSLDKYFKFTMTMISTYEEYDKLVINNLLDIIFTEIEADYFDFKEFLEMRFNDKLKEIYSNKKWFSSLISVKGYRVFINFKERRNINTYD